MSQLLMKGVVEGFYGQLWTPEQRLDIISTIARHGGNTYLYGPKFDEKHLGRWREPYSEEESAILRECAAHAVQCGVTFYWAISPGKSAVDELQNQPLSFTSQEDFDAMQRKINEMRAIGIEHFAVFFDDTTPGLWHEADREVYGDNYALAQADLVNRLQESIDTDLLFMPTPYWGTVGYKAECTIRNNLSRTRQYGAEDAAYLDTIGSELSERIRVGWNGPGIIPAEVAPEDAKSVTDLLRRKPLLWDNYPCNDYANSKYLLGPLTGREPELVNELSGMLFNPMMQAEASKVGVITGLMYANDPYGYDSKQAHQIALRETGLERCPTIVDLSSNTFLAQSREIDDIVERNDKDNLARYCNALLTEECHFLPLERKSSFYAQAVLHALKGEGIPRSIFDDVDAADLAYMLTNSLRDEIPLENDEGVNLLDRFWLGHTQRTHDSPDYEMRKGQFKTALEMLDARSPREKAYVALSLASLDAIDSNSAEPVIKALESDYNQEILLKMCNGF